MKEPVTKNISTKVLSQIIKNKGEAKNGFRYDLFQLEIEFKARKQKTFRKPEQRTQ